MKGFFIMKVFYYKIDKANRRVYGGLNVRASIYEVKRGEVLPVGSCRWCTASFRGEESEVFNALVEMKRIPKKWLESSRCSWRGGGYYAGEVCEKYAIKELREVA